MSFICLFVFCSIVEEPEQILRHTVLTEFSNWSKKSVKRPLFTLFWTKLPIQFILNSNTNYLSLSLASTKLAASKLAASMCSKIAAHRGVTHGLLTRPHNSWGCYMIWGFWVNSLAHKVDLFCEVAAWVVVSASRWNKYVSFRTSLCPYPSIFVARTEKLQYDIHH